VAPIHHHPHYKGRSSNPFFRNIDLSFECKRDRPIAEVKLQVSFKTASITEGKEVESLPNHEPFIELLKKGKRPSPLSNW
jgi:hypothetical protein